MSWAALIARHSKSSSGSSVRASRLLENTATASLVSINPVKKQTQVDYIVFCSNCRIDAKGYICRISRTHTKNLPFSLDSALPCFAAFGEQTSRLLLERFQQGLPHSAIGDHVDKLIMSSVGSAWTRLYDSVRFLTVPLNKRTPTLTMACFPVSILLAVDLIGVLRYMNIMPAIPMLLSMLRNRRRIRTNP